MRYTDLLIGAQNILKLKQRVLKKRAIVSFYFFFLSLCWFQCSNWFSNCIFLEFFFRSHSSHLIIQGALSDAKYCVPEGQVMLLLSLRVSKVSLENCQLNWKSLVQDGWQVNGERSLLANYFS